MATESMLFLNWWDKKMLTLSLRWWLTIANDNGTISEALSLAVMGLALAMTGSILYLASFGSVGHWRRAIKVTITATPLLNSCHKTPTQNMKVLHASISAKEREKKCSVVVFIPDAFVLHQAWKAKVVSYLPGVLVSPFLEWNFL